MLSRLGSKHLMQYPARIEASDAVEGKLGSGYLLQQQARVQVPDAAVS